LEKLNLLTIQMLEEFSDFIEEVISTDLDTGASYSSLRSQIMNVLADPTLETLAANDLVIDEMSRKVYNARRSGELKSGNTPVEDSELIIAVEKDIAIARNKHESIR